MNSDWSDIELLEDYLDGKLDSKAMHEIERRALEDPFVAQALAGLSESPRRASESVSLLQKQLYERIAQQQVQRKESVFTWQRLSVAAAAAVMFISVSILFVMRERVNRENLAKNQVKKVDVTIAPVSPVPALADSVKASDYAVNTPKKTITPGSVPSKAKENLKKEAAADFKPEGKAAVAIADTAIATDQDLKSKTETTLANARVATVAAPLISTPVDGWAKLDAYITENNKLSSAAKSGKFVELTFLIDSEGRPSDIKVIKGAEKEMNEEAVRLISEGPNWEVPESPERRVSYTVAF